MPGGRTVEMSAREGRCRGESPMSLEGLATAGEGLERPPAGLAGEPL